MLVLGVLTVVVLFVFTLTSAVRQQKTLVCSSVQVKIDYESGVSFLTTDDVTSALNTIADDDIVGKPLASLDFRALENGLLKDPYVEKAKIYVDHAGVIHTEVAQKQPIMRIINNDGVGYYLSDKGDKIPLSTKFTAHVPIAIGEIESHEDIDGDSIVLSQLLTLARYMQTDTLIGSLIDHVYVLPDGELDMYTKFGYHTIAFGKADETMKEKFDKLKIFYEQGLTKVGWDKYKVIDLRYRNQIVCRKTEDEKEEKLEKPKPTEQTTESETDQNTTDNIKP